MPKPKKKNLDGDNLLFEGGFMSSKPMSWREPRVCIVCGKEYEPNSPTQKTCGKECSELHHITWRQGKNREYWAANKDRINRDRADPNKPHKTGTPREGAHNLTPSERKERNRLRLARQQNMEEIKRISLESGGDYGKWVAFNDR